MKTTLQMTALAVLATGLACSAFAADNNVREAYKVKRETANANYTAARKACDSLAGNPKDLCVTEAKAARTKANASAEAEYKNTLRAYTNARQEIADANYDVARKHCDSLAGNEKDVCVKEAKAEHVVAIADAKADKKVVEARIDARENKIAALYDVEREKCDVLAGQAKDSCLDNAKAKFGKN